MTDITNNISNRAIPQFRHSNSSLRTADEAKIRAAAIQQHSSPEEQKGIGRLNKAMSSGENLKTNVPRGFYLNIRI